MRFLIDEDVYELTIKFLREHGYDVVKVADIGLRGNPDVVILSYALQHGLVLITRDKGFGSLVFLSKKKEACVILLRLIPETLEEVNNELLKVLKIHSDKLLPGYFIVIEPGKHRVRKKDDQQK